MLEFSINVFEHNSVQEYMKLIGKIRTRVLSGPLIILKLTVNAFKDNPNLGVKN